MASKRLANGICCKKPTPKANETFTKHGGASVLVDEILQKF
jgi:hypothetical protein